MNLPSKWSGAPSSSIFVAELCAGSAGLSLQLQRAGFSTFAVDNSRNRHIQKVPCIQLDLCKDSGWTILCQLLDVGRNLLGVDHLRVVLANNIYSREASFLCRCHDKRVLFLCGKPHRSHMWNTSRFEHAWARRMCLRCPSISACMAARGRSGLTGGPTWRNRCSLR